MLFPESFSYIKLYISGLKLEINHKILKSILISVINLDFVWSNFI